MIPIELDISGLKVMVTHEEGQFIETPEDPVLGSGWPLFSNYGYLETEADKIPAFVSNCTYCGTVYVCYVDGAAILFLGFSGLKEVKAQIAGQYAPESVTKIKVITTQQLKEMLDENDGLMPDEEADQAEPDESAAVKG